MNRWKDQIGGYHIHSDAFAPVTDDFAKRVINAGFTDTSFTETVDEIEMFVPVGPRTMFSYFTDDKKDFNEHWNEFIKIGAEEAFSGYMEGEYAEPWLKILEKPFDASVPFPFKITRRKVVGAPSEPFRETEIHLELDYDKSENPVIKNIVDSGFYGAIFVEDDGRRSLVLTIQGYNHDIIPIQNAVVEYLSKAGGIVAGRIAKEDVREHAEFKVPAAQLPEVVGGIVWQDS